MTHARALFMTAVAASLAASPLCVAAIQMYPDIDSWGAAVGASTQVDFEELEAPVFVTSQYRSLGLFFTPEERAVAQYDSHGQVRVWNMNADANLIMYFTEPIHAVAFDTVAMNGIRARLWLGDEQVGTSSGSFFSPYFHGFISDVMFDRVDLIGSTTIAIDATYFQAIPAPSAALVFLAGAPFVRSRRRSRQLG